MRAFTIRPSGQDGFLGCWDGIKTSWCKQAQRYVVALGGGKVKNIPVIGNLPRAKGMRSPVLSNVGLNPSANTGRGGPHFEIESFVGGEQRVAATAALVRIDLRLPKNTMSLGVGSWQVQTPKKVTKVAAGIAKEEEKKARFLATAQGVGRDPPRTIAAARCTNGTIGSKQLCWDGLLVVEEGQSVGICAQGRRGPWYIFSWDGKTPILIQVRSGEHLGTPKQRLRSRAMRKARKANLEVLRLGLSEGYPEV